MTSVPRPVASDADPACGRSGRDAAPPSGLALYARIQRKLRQEILAGVYAEGEYLPSAGELGKRYGANKNTVLRALRMLRSEGLIDFGRGRGAVVMHSAATAGLAEIAEQLRLVVNRADASGISRAAVVAAIQRIPPAPARHPAARGSAAPIRRVAPPYGTSGPRGRGAA
ncbi:GntR family transcriptional regulator [Streptomyces sp. NPDC005209]|uniref:GntR family transcriptional regulator n=1 Tax=Streptomyces sp. NPDC005209 TaxID=3156715 RepID=UPI0033B8AB70